MRAQRIQNFFSRPTDSILAAYNNYHNCRLMFHARRLTGKSGTIDMFCTDRQRGMGGASLTTTNTQGPFFRIS